MRILSIIIQVLFAVISIKIFAHSNNSGSNLFRILFLRMKIIIKLQEKCTFPAMPENIFGMNKFCYAWYELKYSEIY